MLARRVVPWVASGIIRATWSTSRTTWIRRSIAEEAIAAGPFILAFWHSRLWLAQNALLGLHVTAFISQHDDGELIARTMARFGHAAVRGSSTRGGTRAFRQAVRIARSGGSLAITPDGPRGPARVAKPGAAELARMTGLPILPVSLAYSRAWTFASWDRFEVPLPLGRVAIAYAPALTCPRDASPAEMEALSKRLGDRLDALTAECESSLGAKALA